MHRSAALLLLLLSTPAPVRKTFITLQSTRQSPSDLEVTGLIRSVPSGTSAFLRRADLLTLPQTTATITDDPDYPGPPLHVSGITFETLSHALGVLPESDLITADCTDRYRSHFPVTYIAQHHPILVLTIDGKPLDLWARQAHQYDGSPYIVMYPHFVPAFRLLSHSDQPQLPDNILRLTFSTQARTFNPLAPRGNFAPYSPEQIGFTIAKQNCLRCHFLANSGGTKSGRTWTSLGAWAKEQPAFFQAYIHNPQKLEPHAHMEGSPQYDAATLAALTAYFRTFSDTPEESARP